MKIYTFNAPDNTRVELLWSLRPKNRDKIFDKFITQTNYTEVNSIQNCHIAIYPQKAFNPETLVFDNSVFDAAMEADKYNRPLVIDGTSDSDVLLDIPTASILRCGLYKSLKKTFETECPFWSNYRTKIRLDTLKILPKGKKPAVGFCGTISSIGKLSSLGKIFLPNKISKLVLSQGKIARQIDIRLREGMSLQLRDTAIALLSSDSRIDSHFNISDPHKSYYFEDDSNRIFLENLFVDNMNKCDYTLCIRGTGNYSGRLYMTLNAGRIPVIIDTDVVIPYEEKLHILKVPVNSLEKIGDLILEHFEQTTEQELLEMKMGNRAAYNQFLAPEKFLPNFLQTVSQ
ncbi:hypothetical protein [Pleurocapsa sp. PCC 7319]|uniref:hypothetical protein n=1 Tax=Pleurocapsa sp. PCC 7319 TaxID=118161 RepID=UPI00034D990B|nr:hypothetical protein [Pleurocapsa sp. PCC 7319]